MATTTPNYGWAVPTSTDLVKDGATAIETLGDAIDASMNTALGTKKAGMVLLNTTSFSGVSSISVNDVFSTTYNNYKILVNAKSSGAGEIAYRNRVSGADASGANYNLQINLFISSTGLFSQSVNATSARIGESSDNWAYTVIDVANPFLASPTSILSATQKDTSTGLAMFTYAAGHTLSTSYTGFTLILSSGTFSSGATLSVYGYNK